MAKRFSMYFVEHEQGTVYGSNDSDKILELKNKYNGIVLFPQHQKASVDGEEFDIIDADDMADMEEEGEG
jgi:hypothetical protein